ncbi:MAG: DnaB-like helicase C-terminal domain-containing protein [Herbinix sp.]|nr:DnaB-like helicase C-terminal domain-containing protein [Herbinix sp.]
MANILNFTQNKMTLETKLPFKFDLNTFNLFIGFIYIDTNKEIKTKEQRAVTKKSLGNLYRLLKMTDEKIYIGKPELEERLNFCIKSLESILEAKMVTRGAIIENIREINNNIQDNIIDNIPRYERLNLDEIRFINRMIEDRLKFSFVETICPRITSLLETKESGAFKSYAEISNALLDACKEYVNKCRAIVSLEDVNEFSLADDSFVQTIEKVISNLNDPSKILYTGIRALNTLLSPGYLSGRLYTYLGLPGGFKSGLLLKSAIDIRKYNKNIVLKDPSKTPCVLLITMENTVEESVERLFNMTVGSESSMADMTTKQVVKTLKVDGEMNFEGNGDCDLRIRYYPNMSISTDDIYNIIDDLSDSGYEVIGLILDYIKRIRPSRRSKDEKEELKNVTNELKSIAVHYNIPVITAHQLNRESARIVDTAELHNKSDATNELGRTHTGSAWEVIENSDFACIINLVSVKQPSKKKTDEDTSQFYLTFKRVKIRYKPMQVSNIFSHPFEFGNRIKLLDDVNLKESLSIINVNNDMSGTERNEKNKTRRGVVNQFTPMNDDYDADEIFKFS